MILHLEFLGGIWSPVVREPWARPEDQIVRKYMNCGYTRIEYNVVDPWGKYDTIQHVLRGQAWCYRGRDNYTLKKGELPDVVRIRTNPYDAGDPRDTLLVSKTYVARMRKRRARFNKMRHSMAGKMEKKVQYDQLLQLGVRQQTMLSCLRGGMTHEQTARYTTGALPWAS